MRNRERWGALGVAVPDWGSADPLGLFGAQLANYSFGRPPRPRSRGPVQSLVFCQVEGTDKGCRKDAVLLQKTEPCPLVKTMRAKIRFQREG